MAQQLQKSTYGTGLRIVFLHGWGLNSGVWHPVIERLVEDYELITVDLPGFGVNHEIVPDNYSLDVISQLIVETVGKPAIYVGWSLGGLVASNIAIRHPDSCLGLVTVASSPSFKQQDNWPGIKPEFLAAFYHQLSKNIEQTLNSFLKVQAMGSPHIRQDLKQIQQLIMAYPLPDKRALKLGLDLLDASDLRNDIGHISVPFIRFYGKLDSIVPKLTVDKVDSLAATSEHYIFEKASHAPFISDLEEFVTELSKWLGRFDLSS